MFLILSGTYIEQELRAEFGSLPPSFLPLGNKRLFEHQLSLIPEGESIFLSLPDDYDVSSADHDLLNYHQVQTIKTPHDLSLGQAIVACMNLVDLPTDGNLKILFGDTLFSSLPKGEDIVSVSSTVDNYDWSSMGDSGIVLSKGSSDENLISGYFCFSQPRELVRCLTQEKWDFLSALNRYKQVVGLLPSQVERWYDFGHVNTYYQSKASFTTQRAFNELSISRHTIIKSSKQDQKIRAEANWFRSIPSQLRIYTPQYLGDNLSDSGVFSYSLEYLYNTALNELYVFSEVPLILWKNIFKHCLDFLDECSRVVPEGQCVPSTHLSSLFSDKTKNRIADYCSQKCISSRDVWQFNESTTASIDDMISLSQKYLPEDDTRGKITLMHGDFCFSNILYDFRTDRIKAIDPRGITPEGELSVFGDVRYDIAKLSHSILGLYDFIVAGYHTTRVDYETKIITQKIQSCSERKELQDFFVDLISVRYGIYPVQLYAMQLQLFLSMLPLHSDDLKRQDGLFANAFRIYEIIKRYES